MLCYDRIGDEVKLSKSRVSLLLTNSESNIVYSWDVIGNKLQLSITRHLLLNADACEILLTIEIHNWPAASRELLRNFTYLLVTNREKKLKQMFLSKEINEMRVKL